MPADERKRLIRQYTRFLKQIRSVRRAMADYFAGQRFFDFYSDEPEEEEAEFELKPPARSRQQAGRRGQVSNTTSRRMMSSQAAAFPLTGPFAGPGE